MSSREEALERALANLPPWEIGGITDPIGQISAWLWQQIQGAFSSISGAISGWISGAVTSITGWINTNLSGLVSFAGSIGTSFKNFVGDPIGTIKGTLAWIWANIPSAITGPLTIVSNVLGTVGQGLIDFIKDPISKLKDLGSWIWSITPDFIRGPLSSIGAFMGSVGQAFLDFAKDPIGAISKGLKALSDAFNPIVASLGDFSKKIGDLVKLPVDTLSKGIGDILSGKVFDWFSSAFSQAIGGIGDAIITSIVSPVSTFITDKVFTPLEEGASGIWKWLLDAGGNIFKYMTGTLPSQLLGALDFIVNGIKSVFSQFFGGITAGLATLAGTNSEQFMGAWPGIVAGLAVIPIGTTALISLAQTKVAGFGLDLKPLGDILTSLANPLHISGPIISAIVGASIGVIATRWANNQYRLKVPDVTTAYQMLAQQVIDEGQFKGLARDSGYSEAWAEAFIETWDWSPKLSDAISLTATFELDQTFLDQAFKNSRIPSNWLQYWQTYLTLRPLRNEIASWIGAIVSMRGIGYYTQAAFNAALDSAKSSNWIRQNEVSIRQAQGEIALTHNIIDNQVSTFRYQFRKGIIGDAGLEAALVALGIDPQMANSIKENELARAGLTAGEA
jgi:hypothetical protein